MIYTIGMQGLLATRFGIDDKPKAVHRTYDPAVRGVISIRQRGCLVWATWDEAQEGAAFQNEKSANANPSHQRGFFSNWVVVGVDADWDRDTELQDFAPWYPTANELTRPAILVEMNADNF